MNNLVYLFNDDLCSTENISGTGSLKTTKETSHPKIPLTNQSVYGVSMLKNKSEPSFIASKVCCGLPQSSSLPDTRSLPLNLPPEQEDGNIEYKLKLVNPTPDRLEHLISQMNWRLNEGGGQAIYRLGVDDGGSVTGLTAKEMSASLLTLYKMAEKLGADIRLMRECTISSSSDSVVLPSASDKDVSHFNPQRKAIELHIKWKVPPNKGVSDLRVAMLGSADAGKSTLVGVLTDGEMDDGRGRARLHIFGHLHEVLSGRTSSLSKELIGFDASGRLINRRRSRGQLNKRTTDEIVRDSNRLITLLDLAGYSKYQRTTFSGLMTLQPAFCILVISATTGLTTEGFCHARLAAALGLPLVVVVTKVDLVSPSFASTSLEAFTHHPQSGMSIVPTGCLSDVSRSPELIELQKCVLQELRTIKLCYRSDFGDRPSLRSSVYFEEAPLVFAVSSVSGYGVDNLLNFLAQVSDLEQQRLMRPKLTNQPSDEPLVGNNLVICWVTKVFSNVPGVNAPVIEVLVKQGQICENQRFWLGPNKVGGFEEIRVVELRHNWRPHHVLYKDQLGSLVAVVESSSSEATFPQARRGMVMVNAPPSSRNGTNPYITACRRFSVANLIWLAQSSDNACLHLGTSVGVYTGNVALSAHVYDITFSYDKMIRAVERLEGSSNSVILRLDPSHKVVIDLRREVVFLELGRKVIISFENTPCAVGKVADFSEIITTFSNPVSPHVSPSPSLNRDSCSRSPSPWKAVSDMPSNISYEALLFQIGIDPEGPRTHFIDEPPLPPDFVTFDDTSNRSNKRRQHASKRRRKAAARLAWVTASASEVTSSTSTWSSHCNGSACLAAEQKNEETDDRKVVTAPHNTSLGSDASSRSRRKRWKRRHRR